MAEQAIYAQLAAITAFGNRIYPMVLPQNVQYPAATYQRISAPRVSAFRRDVEPVEATIQVDVYSQRGSGFPAHVTLTEAVRAALQRQSSGTVIDMMLETERDDYEDEHRPLPQVLRRAYLVSGDVGMKRKCNCSCWLCRVHLFGHCGNMKWFCFRTKVA